METSITSQQTGKSREDYRTATAGIMMYMLAPLGMTLIPLLVGGAAKDLGFSDSQVGFLAAADLIGLAVASVSAVFWIHRISWRKVALASITIIVVGNALSATATSFAFLCLARFVTEFGSGGIFSLALVTLAATRNPDRFFAIGIGMTIAVAVAIFLWLPSVIDRSGIFMVFAVHAAVALLVLPSVLWLRTSKSQDERKTGKDPEASYWPLFICFVGFSCFTIAEGGVWSYVERIGDAAGFTSAYVGKVLAVTQVVSFLSAMAASALSTRFGRSLPIIFGITVFIIGLYLLLQPESQVYLVAACLTQFAWIFVLPYLLAVCVELDPSGHYYVLTTAFKMGGFSAGPAIIAMFLGDNGYALVSWIGIGFLVLSLLLIAPLTLKLDRMNRAAAAVA